MFTKEESKEIRKQFWVFFGKRYQRKWLLYNTGIKDFSLKFDFDNSEAIVAIESTSVNQIDRLYYYEKITSLQSIITKEVSQKIIFEENHFLKTGKVISRAYILLDDVNIHNKNHWPQVFEFFFKYMSQLENFYLEYQDYIKS